jgi:hypothetical protein
MTLFRGGRGTGGRFAAAAMSKTTCAVLAGAEPLNHDVSSSLPSRRLNNIACTG